MLPLIPLALLGSAGYVANDFTSWMSRDDGTPPPAYAATSPSIFTFKNVLILGALGAGGYLIYKRIAK